MIKMKSGLITLIFSVSIFIYLNLDVKADRKSTDKQLKAEDAKAAILSYLVNNPHVFTSPGKSTTSNEIKNAKIIKKQSIVLIDGFKIDLNKFTYSLSHDYGNPQKGNFETWQWEGKFLLGKDGRWKIERPILKKIW